LLLREFEENSADWLWKLTPSAASSVPRPLCPFGRLDPLSVNGMPFLQVLAGPTWDAGNFAAGCAPWPRSSRAATPFATAAPGQSRAKSAGGKSPRRRARRARAFIGFRGVGSDVTEQRGLGRQDQQDGAVRAR